MSNGSIKIKVVPTGLLDVNCCLVSNADTKEIFLIDPGGNEDFIYEYITKNDADLKCILHTHAHFDHIAGGSALIEKYYKDHNIPVYLHSEDQYLWDNISSQASMFGISVAAQSVKINNFLKDNDVLDICGLKVGVMHTPGHSPGSCTFSLNVDEDILVVGDVIFKNSIGRTDLWKGDYEVLMKSINDKILTHPDKTRIIAGHGPDTTVGEEKKLNPFLSDLR
ncbi:MAG: MBL fold metallo-hydrolase [Spirochaetia bacterium]|nr:MBL fold metallo-hydrolase [Spirochaetia bacterium]